MIYELKAVQRTLLVTKCARNEYVTQTAHLGFLIDGQETACCVLPVGVQLPHVHIGIGEICLCEQRGGVVGGERIEIANGNYRYIGLMLG